MTIASRDAVLEQSVRRSCSPFWGIPLRQDSARIGVECKKQTGPISRCGYNLTTRKEDTDAIRRTTGLNRVSEVKEELRSGSFGDDKVSVCRTGGVQTTDNASEHGSMRKPHPATACQANLSSFHCPRLGQSDDRQVPAARTVVQL